MLSLQNIDVISGTGNKVLQGLCLKVCHGEFVVVIGSNGTGKSTLLNVIAGFKKPTCGQVIIDNKDVTHLPQCTKSNLVSKVMQDPNVGTMANMTIFENMVFALKRGAKRGLLPFNNAQRKNLIKEKLAILSMGLENRVDELVSNLSGGQRQALSLLMAIMAQTKILLLDEITAALDPQSTNNIMEIANNIIRQEKLTCVMVTHNLEQAARYGDRVLQLIDGQIQDTA